MSCVMTYFAISSFGGSYVLHIMIVFGLNSCLATQHKHENIRKFRKLMYLENVLSFVSPRNG